MWARRVGERREEREEEREKWGGRGVFIPSQWLKANGETATSFDPKGKAPDRGQTARAKNHTRQFAALVKVGR